MAAHPEKKSSKRDVILPSEWASLEDIFSWVTERGLRKPSKYKICRLWICTYPVEEFDRQRFVQISRNVSGLESLTYAIREEEIIVLYSFKSPRPVSYLSDNKLIGGYEHIGAISAGRKKDFICHLMRGGCVVSGEGVKARLPPVGRSAEGKKVALCSDIQTINPLDRYFAPGFVDEKPDIVVEVSTEEDLESESESDE
jgi:hypothetical protein